MKVPISVMAIAVLAAALATQTQAAAYQEEQPSLRADVTPRKGVTVGDPLVCSLTAGYPEDWSVSFPGLGEQLGEFQVLETELTPASIRQGKAERKLTARLTIFRTGKFEIPSLSATFTDPEGNQVEKATKPVAVEVVSVVKEKSPELKDLKPQAEIAESYLWVWIGAGCVLAVAGLALLIKKILARRRATADRTVPTIPLPPPHEEALRALESLLSRKLLAAGRLKLFYYELSEIIRRMVGRHFGIITLERTTGEIIGELALVSNEALSPKALDIFLTRCDLIKFAEYQPMPAEQEGLLAAARGFIEDVRKSFESTSGQQPESTAGSEGSRRI